MMHLFFPFFVLVCLIAEEGEPCNKEFTPSCKKEGTSSINDCKRKFYVSLSGGSDFINLDAPQSGTLKGEAGPYFGIAVGRIFSINDLFNLISEVEISFHTNKFSYEGPTGYKASSESICIGTTFNSILQYKVNQFFRPFFGAGIGYSSQDLSIVPEYGSGSGVMRQIIFGSGFFINPITTINLDYRYRSEHKHTHNHTISLSLSRLFAW